MRKDVGPINSGRPVPPLATKNQSETKATAVMFEPIERTSQGGRRALAFLSQQFAVPLIALVVEVMMPYRGLAWVQLLLGLVGCPLAVWLYAKFRSVRKSGGWIWVMPALSLSWEAYLLWRSPTGDLGGLLSDPATVGFLTAPCLACFTYSVGVFVMSKASGKKGEIGQP